MRAAERRVDDVLGPEDVVGHGLLGILFHQRHVLVCGRVKHDVGLEPLEDAAGAVAIANVGDNRGQPGIREALAQAVHRLEDAVLTVPEQHQLRGPRVHDLAAQLGPDRAAGPCHQDHVPTHVARRIRIHGHGHAAQQVRNVHFAQPVDGHLSVEQLEYAWHDPRRDAQPPAIAR